MSYKTPLAIAVATVALSSTAVAAPSVNFYGFVDIGLETYSSSLNSPQDQAPHVFAGGGSDDPANAANGNSDDREFALTNGVQSRLGVKGEEDLGDGWTGSYRVEARINVLDDGGQFARTRLGWFGLSNGEHSIKVGAQWSPFFEYSAWNTHRGEVKGMGTYFYITEVMPGSVGYGYRNDSTINYTFGGGGFSNSPFTATVALHIAEDGRETTVGAKPVTAGGNPVLVNGEPLTQGGSKQLLNDSGITAVTVGGAATFGSLTLNAVGIKSLVKESRAAKDANIDVAAPMIYSLGGKFQATEQLELGLAYRVADRDTGDDDGKTSTTVAAAYKASEKLTVNLGYGVGEDDNKANLQLDGNIFGSAYYQLSGNRLAGFEFEEADYGDDGKVQAFMVSLRQSF
ncbi:porin [Bacterioplanoides pacificum]|uniref:Porin n=1 Tax=Bacterioplanoides pacificum TaxID=1171596 RepID=A0ABV7VU28_9GAMM